MLDISISEARSICYMYFSFSFEAYILLQTRIELLRKWVLPSLNPYAQSHTFFTVSFPLYIFFTFFYDGILFGR